MLKKEAQDAGDYHSPSIPEPACDGSCFKNDQMLTLSRAQLSADRSHNTEREMQPGSSPCPEKKQPLVHRGCAHIRSKPFPLWGCISTEKSSSANMREKHWVDQMCHLTE